MKEKFNHIDDTLRSITGDFEKTPPEKAWKGISRKMFLKDLLSFNLKNYQFRFYSSVLVILLLISVIFWGIIRQNSQKPVTHKENITADHEQPGSVIDEKNNNAVHVIHPAPPLFTKNPKDTEPGKPEISYPAIIHHNHDNGSFVNITPAKTANDLLPVPDPEEIYEDNSFAETINKVFNDTSGMRGAEQTINPLTINCDLIADFEKPSENEFTAHRQPETSIHNYPEPFSAALGLYIGRDAADNQYVKEKYFHGNLLNVFFELRRAPLFFRTGLGVNEAVSKYGYTKSYSKSEAVGYYYRLDSVVADVYPDSILNKTVFILHYYTSLVKLYDTLDYAISGSYFTRYNYLEVPLFLGYRKQFSRFGFYLAAGPVCSFLIKKEKEEIKANEENVIYSSITYHDKDMVRFFWQLQLFAGLEYLISPNISITAEPTIKYLDNSFINNTEYAQNQILFGIRYGLVLHIR